MRIAITILIGILLWSNNKAIGQTIDTGRKIVIVDAGHGGVDSGAVSKEGLQEKDVVLDIAHHMIVWNKVLLASKYDIYLTRDRDTLISLTDRTKLAKHLKPAVFISLHCNHIDDYRIKGVEGYTYDDTNLSKWYAKAILNALNQNLDFKTREPKQANFQVLTETEGYCPSVLLELGYLSNSDESDYLKDSAHRKILALAILMAI